MATARLTPNDLVEQVTPAAPPAGYLRVYAKSDDNLYKQNSAGVEAVVGGGGSAAPPVTPTSNLVLAANSQTIVRRLVITAAIQVVIPADAELVFV